MKYWSGPQPLRARGGRAAGGVARSLQPADGMSRYARTCSSISTVSQKGSPSSIPAAFKNSVELRNAQTTARTRYLSEVKHILLWIALVLFITWVVVRLAVAVTSVVFNLLWIVALVFLLIWVVKRFA